MTESNVAEALARGAQAQTLADEAEVKGRAVELSWRQPLPKRLASFRAAIRRFELAVGLTIESIEQLS